MDVFEEIRAVSAEAARLAREGGSVEERAAHDARKARVMAALEEQATRAIAPVVGVSDRTAAYDVAAVQVCTPEPAVDTETRAIAPVVGVTHKTVVKDLSSGVRSLTPAVNVETGAIAPVVGTSHMAVSRDLAAPVAPATPEPAVGLSHQGVSDRQARYDAQVGSHFRPDVNTETGEVSDDYPESGTGPQCQDWPLCGHDDGHACEEHAAIARTIERTKSALRERGAL